jgi:hypothetical protein
MVDDLNVEALPTSGIEITLTKWGGKGNNRSAKVVPMAETPMMNV